MWGRPQDLEASFVFLIHLKIGNSAYLPAASGYHMDRRRKRMKSLLRSQGNGMVISDSVSQIFWVCFVGSHSYLI